jgi:hypothetical protein
MSIGTCGICEKIEDVRPYGVDKSFICFECMMASEERQAEAHRQMNKIFDEHPIHVLDENGFRLPNYDEIVEIMDYLEHPEEN